MSRGIQRFAPRCMICKRSRRPHNAIELLRSDNDGAWVRCKICGRESYRRSWAARHRAIKSDLSTLSADTDNNQLGAHLCGMWDEQRATLGSGKWCAEAGCFVTLAEWVELRPVAAVVVQPLDGNRDRRPVSALPEDVEPQP